MYSVERILVCYVYILNIVSAIICSSIMIEAFVSEVLLK